MSERALRVHDDGDFPGVAALDNHLADAGDAAEQRPENVVSLVAQILAGNIAIEDEADHRKDGWCEALNLHLGFGREAAARFRDACLNKLKGVLHVHGGVEKNGDFARAADGLRTDAPHAKHTAGRLLERPRYCYQHGARGEVAGIPQDTKPWKIKFGKELARTREEGETAP